MKIISKFKAFFDFNNIYDTDNYIVWKKFSKDSGIYNRIKEFIIESNIVPSLENSNDIKIKITGFDTVTSFRNKK